MGKIIAIANQKGGVGKTTSTINLGMFAVEDGSKCLFLDFDPQNNCGQNLAPEQVATPEFKNGDSLANAIKMFEGEVKAEPFLVKENVYVIGACKKMANITQENIYNMDDSLRLIKDDYDYIFIDCPPSIGPLQHAALMLSDYLLVVSEAGTDSVKGVRALMQSAFQVKKRFNQSLEIAGIVLNNVNTRKIKHQEKSIEALIEEYGDLVFESRMHQTIKVAEAAEKGLALFQYSPKHAEDFGFIATSVEFFSRIAE